MEPMSTTPSSSPVMTAAANSVFLPSYLMGDNQSTPKTSDPFSQIYGRSTNVANNKLDYSQRQHLFLAPDDSLMQNKDQMNASNYNQTVNVSVNKSRFEIKDRTGPPSTSLFDSFNDDSFQSPEVPSTSFIQKKNNDPISPRFNESFQKMPPFLAKQDCSDFWVTVFGFPPDLSVPVLQFFSKICNIKDKKSQNQGNWMHLMVGTKNEFNRMMSYNGKIILNKIMIGVQPYRLHQFDNKESNQSPINPITRARPLNQSNVTLNSSINHNDLLSTSVYNLPQQSSGVVTKAMEYLFGW